MHLFRLFVDFFGWLVMQYKVIPTSSVYSPTNGPLIKLWNVYPNGCPKLLIKVPSQFHINPIWGHDTQRSMEKEKFINARLSKYVEF
jgi:hypothetical protein